MSDTIKKEFAVAQLRLNEIVLEHRRASELIVRKEHEHKMAILTSNELATLPAETPVYRTFGKAFLLSGLNQIKERLSMVRDDATIEREKLLTRKTQLEESIVAAEQKAKTLYEELNSAD